MPEITKKPQTPLSRQELYDLVWNEPLSKVAPRFGLSGPGPKKVCMRHQILTRGRGYRQSMRHTCQASRESSCSNHARRWPAHVTWVRTIP